MDAQDRPIVAEGPYEDGKRRGHWVERFPGGLEMEGPNEVGQRNGRWVMRRRGQEHEIRFSNGVQER